jgi:ABC-type Mn2+/Zn2+ transport system ATPase subunit
VLGQFLLSAISVKNLNVSYYGNDAIQNVSFSISPGKLVGIIGPDGEGKSTLLKALLELIPRDKGEIQINGKLIKLSGGQQQRVMARALAQQADIFFLDTVCRYRCFQ